MEIELHELDLRYAALRRRDGKRERSLVASLAESGQQVPVVVVRGEAVRSFSSTATSGCALSSGCTTTR